MIKWDAFTIVSLLFSEKEKQIKSRRRNGYNMYISRYFGDFKLLSEEEKESHLIASGVWVAPVLSLSGKDSTITVPSYKACHTIMTAARHWHNLNKDSKYA
eukprot:12188909-Ditylum_brightwellii.AAC.1